VAASFYPDRLKIAGTPLLTDPAWIPVAPLPLQELALAWAPPAEPAAMTGDEPVTRHLRPLRPDGTRYPSYSAAVADL
jgi:hypothetical protein